MRIDDLVTIIEKKEVANDILYGNTISQMFDRASRNTYLISVDRYVSLSPSIIDYLLNNFEIFINNEARAKFSSLGTFVSYLAVFRKYPTMSVRLKLASLLTTLSNDSLLSDMTKFLLERFEKERFLSNINNRVSISYGWLPTLKIGNVYDEYFLNGKNEKLESITSTKDVDDIIVL